MSLYGGRFSCTTAAEDMHHEARRRCTILPVSVHHGAGLGAPFGAAYSFVFEIGKTVKDYQGTFTFQVSHYLRYTVFRWYCWSRAKNANLGLVKIAKTSRLKTANSPAYHRELS